MLRLAGHPLPGDSYARTAEGGGTGTLNTTIALRRMFQEMKYLSQDQLLELMTQAIRELSDKTYESAPASGDGNEETSGANRDESANVSEDDTAPA
jgi:hypothetical protein